MYKLINPACSIITKDITQKATQSFLASTSLKRFYATGEEQDLIVIGGGPGGYVGAIKAAQLGFKVTCIESRGKLGGTCLNVGCIPSKALLKSSHFYHEASHYPEKNGIKYDNLQPDLDGMMQSKARAVTGLTSGIESLFKKNKVAYAKGHGTILSANEVEVSKPDGTKETIKTKNIMIATGSDIASLPGIEIDEEKIVSSTGALELKEIPKRLTVIGAGVIGVEMGSVWSRLGSEVNFIEFANCIMSGSDIEVGKQSQKIFQKQGMKFHLKRKVVKLEKTATGVTIHTEAASGGDPQSSEADIVLVAVGRKPNTQGLGLQNAGVKVSDRGIIETDDHFQTNIPGIYAIGDVIKGPMLAHKAEEEGVAVAENLKVPGTGHVNYGAIPSVVYTHPEIAWVGKTEEELKKEGIKYKIGKFPMMANSRARTQEDADGFVKFLADAETDRLLGAHIVAASAGELIAECTLALEYGASSEDIARTCHAHPTLSEAVKEAALGTYAKTINF